MSRDDRIRTAVVDHHEAIGFLVASTLEADGRFDVVAETAGASAGLDLIERMRPLLAVIDLRGGYRDAQWLVRRLQRRDLGTVLAVVTEFDDARARRRFRAAGADAVICKSTISSSLADRLADLVQVRLGCTPRMEATDDLADLVGGHAVGHETVAPLAVAGERSA